MLFLLSVTVRYGFAVVLIFALFYYIVQPPYSAAGKRLSSLEKRAGLSLDTQIGIMEAGLEHIRAFGKVPRAAQELRAIVNESQKSEYCRLQSKSRLHLLCTISQAFISASVVASGLLFKEKTSRSVFGVMLYCTTNHAFMLRILLLTCHEVEKYLVKIDRIKAFCENTPLEKEESVALSLNGQWPETGGLDFHHATITSG